MHRCKIKTENRIFIQNEEYQRVEHAIANEIFRYGCKKAQEELLGQTYKEEVRVYQEEFSLPYKRNMFGLLIIPIYINHVKFNFLFDTGAQISGLRMQCFKKAQVKYSKEELSVGSIGGSQKALKGCIVDSLVFGGREYLHKPMILLDDDVFALRFGKMDLVNFDGIIGWDILSQLDFECDDVAQVIKVIKNKFKFPCQNMIKGSFPICLVKDDRGKVFVFGFDSGSKLSWINKKLIENEHLKVVCDGEAMGFGVHGKEKLAIKIVDRMDVQLDRGKISLFGVNTGKCDLFPHFEVDGVFGNEIFRNRRMRIVNSRNVILLV